MAKTNSSSRHARKGRPVLAACVALGSLGALVGVSTADATPRSGGHRHIQLRVRGGTVTVDTASLGVTARTADGHAMELSAPAASDLGEPGPLRRIAGGARWTYPAKKLTVTAVAQQGRLQVRIRSQRDGSLAWPVTGGDPASESLQLPRGSGLDIPVRDSWWNSAAAHLVNTEVDMGEGLTLPLWGYSSGKRGVSYLTPTDINTSLGFASEHGRLRSTATHDFDEGDGTRAYDISFALTDGGATAPAVDYRKSLSERGELGSLRQKIRANPANAKLLGAFHAYGWGEARTAAGVAKLRKLGIDRMWLGYDADASPMSSAAVSAAEQAGYLVGPYDSFANGQDPASADSPAGVWPDRVYPDFCVQQADGTPQGGFGDRGCYLSSQAFEQAEPQHHYLADRTRRAVANGADSYFLDVDATGTLFRDYSADHPMTKAQDRANRLARMKRLSGSLVLGSESAQPWANQALAFDHGSATPVDDRMWTLEHDKKTWGSYYPQTAPAFFFKPVALPADIAKAMYDPRYRVPLYETALHGSVINAERWELSFDKLPAQKTDRALLAMLYNSPLNYVLDGPSIDQYGSEMAALQKYFAPLHRAAGTEQLTSFRWLTGDRGVQRTVFGHGVLTVTANFGKTARDGLPGGCVDAKLRGDREPRRLCPAQVIR
ncbi:glycoside hydrolase [Streptomyces sp. NPDC088348]|uniref:glycoside hydrolase n=1 Tax=Streptomyces sp. NPDC088348 TaxID=3365853 RepID=UPI00380C9DA9